MGALALLARPLPQIRSLADYRPAQSSFVYAHGGEPLAHFSVERRTVVDVAQLPPVVAQAFIAAEDASFYAHEGIDYAGIVRAALKNLRPGAHLQGASTITQQTVKTLVLGNERSYARKLREILLARQLEQVLSKAEILHIYLNQIYFGHGAYGIEAASRLYFAKSASELDLGEASLLAAVPKFPNRYNIKSDPAAAKLRQRYVLDQMLAHRWCDAAAHQAALARPVPPVPAPPATFGLAPHYVEQVRRSLLETLGEQRLYTGGLSIVTALNLDLQKAATTALRQGIEAVSRKHGWRGASLRVAPDNLAAHRKAWQQALANLSCGTSGCLWDLGAVSVPDLAHASAGGRSLKAVPPAVGQRLRAPVVRLEPARGHALVDLGGAQGRIALADVGWARRFNPDAMTARPRQIGDVLQPGDLIWVEVAAIPSRGLVELALVPEPEQEGALVAIEPHQRAVLALVGGYRQEGSGFNRATQALRQPGSAFKPILYAAALKAQVITPISRCQDSPVVIADPFTGTSWKPTNYEDGHFDGPLTYRTALLRSKNTCSVKLLQKMGLEPALATARAMGLTNPQPRNLTLALGTGETSLLDLTNAYATIADGGSAQPPVFVTEVRQGNKVVALPTSAAVQALSPQVAYVLTDMMQAVVERGTARGARALGRPVAGKTGTSQESRSVWFAGFSPHLAAGVFMGFDNNEPLGHETGASAALPAWVAFMREALAAEPKVPFAMPPGIVTRRVDIATGDVVAPTDPSHPEGTPNSIEEVFVAGTEPPAEAQPKPLRSIFLEDEEDEGGHPAGVGKMAPAAPSGEGDGQLVGDDT